MNSGFQLFPEQASDFAARVDALYLFLLLVTGFFTTLIAALVLGFAVYFKRGRARRGPAPRENKWLEIVWTAVPLVLTMVMFTWGATLFVDMHRGSPDAEEIDVVGKQWMWKLRHPGGKSEINQLHLPVGRPVRLRMISEDVIHSFYVPAFRVKQDVLPGRYTTLSFTPTREGTYHLFCAEYCGTSHAQMRGQVIVMSEAKFAEWLSGRDPGAAAMPSGEELFQEFRCHTCHTETPEGRGPSLVGLFGQEVQLQDGRKVVVDENYLRESILEPQAKVVAGYRPLMPTYRGQIGEEGILQLIDYIKSREPPPER